jgi:hypothetical protein
VGGGLPFSAEQFFAVFAAYNEATWPAPIVAYALGLAAAAVPLAAYNRHSPDLVHKAAVAVLALMWAWTGIAYHALFFSKINAAAFAFAALFIAQAAVLVAAGRSTRFEGAAFVDTLIGAFFVVYAMVLYPLIGLWTGHVYPAAPAFGVTPCPVTIFTFGLLLQTKGHSPWLLVAIPIVWSLIGGSAAFLLGVVQDWVLLFSGVVAAWRLAVRRGT